MAQTLEKTSNATLDPSGKFTLSDREFDAVRETIRDLTGISIAESKRLMIFRRLVGRLKAHGLATFTEYLDFLKKGDAKEIEIFSNAVTTNLTSFFRENHHFEFLANEFFPEIMSKTTGFKRLRIWSAGCSTGEEPYSIAMTLKEHFPNLKSWDAKVLCTDLDSDVLKKCRAGQYNTESLDNVPAKLKDRWFKDLPSRPGFCEVRPELQTLLTFNRLNLMQGWPMKGKFDLIFCRNVIIYFDKPTRRVLIDRYADILNDGGYLILGHSESLFDTSTRFDLIGKTIYRKIQ